MGLTLTPDFSVQGAGICAESASMELWLDVLLSVITVQLRTAQSTWLRSTLALFRLVFCQLLRKSDSVSPWPDNDLQTGRGCIHQQFDPFKQFGRSVNDIGWTGCFSAFSANQFCRFGRNEHLRSRYTSNRTALRSEEWICRQYVSCISTAPLEVFIVS